MSNQDTRDLVLAGIASLGLLGGLVALNRLLKQPISLPPIAKPIKKRVTGGLIVVAPPCGVIQGDDMRAVQSRLRTMTGPVDLVIHCYGGLIAAVNPLVHAIRSYPGQVTAFVPYYAFSGGTMLALAASKIVMGQAAVLGPVDPQLGGVPASSLMQLHENKSADEIGDQFHILAIEARKYDAETKAMVARLGVNDAAIKRLTSGTSTHGSAITFEEAKALKLKVMRGVPAAYYELVDRGVSPLGWMGL